jgi:short-subunit dehydrogenase
VTALCPGPTETNFFNVANAKAFEMKGMQTPEAVVETALSGVRRGKQHIISGWTNYLGARLQNFVPNSLLTRVVGKVLRPQIEKNLEKK